MPNENKYILLNYSNSEINVKFLDNYTRALTKCYSVKYMNSVKFLTF